MPQRTYERYPVATAFKLQSKIGKEFGEAKELNMLSEQFRNHLIKHNEKFNVSVSFFNYNLTGIRRKTEQI